MQEAQVQHEMPQVLTLKQDDGTDEKGHPTKGLQLWQSKRAGTVDVSHLKGKLYEDEMFGPLHSIQLEDVTLTGAWDLVLVDESDNTFVLQLVNHISGDSITLAFPSPLERKGFAESIVSLGHVRQVGYGMDLEGLVQKPDTSGKNPWIAAYAATVAAAADLAALISRTFSSKNVERSIDVSFSRLRT